ncbi:MAG TPA: tetratricopeptide repeat protein [Verrucomicrobiae bacterium]|nr:tetratricopeptide repeat protein [Verrucomicrobiae bacterium]
MGTARSGDLRRTTARLGAIGTGALIWLAATGAAFAGSGDEFKSANRLYDAGRFAEAAAIYEKIEPKTAHVYYNLGNAQFREGELGLAILDYERARRLAPRDPDILANLKFAEQRAGVDDVNAPPRAWQRYVRSIVRSRTPTEWGVYELAALWLTILAIGAWLYLPRLRTGLLAIAAVGCVGFAASVFALGREAFMERSAPTAVVVAKETDARFAPVADATIHFKLAEGTRVVIREDRGQWVFVERADGQQGWARSDAVERVAPRS